jgi:hypothetical protein
MEGVMKKITCIVLAAIAMTVALSSPAVAGHSHVGIGIAIGPGWYPRPVAPYYPYYPYYPFAYSPPVIVQQPRQDYVQIAPREDRPGYWYYCPDAKGYYPHVKRCPSGWLKVVPPSIPPE